MGALPGLTQYVWTWRLRPRRSLAGADAAAERARDACPRVLGKRPSTIDLVRVERTTDGSGWHVVLRVDGRRIKVTMDTSGAIVCVTVGTASR